MDTIRKLIKEKNQRFTIQKEAVFRILMDKPQTALGIYNRVQETKGSIDKATVYRILTSFVKLGVVREVHFGGNETLYELSSDKHHHHLICETCGDISDISIGEEVILNEVQKKTSFKIKNHTLEFFGTCKKCQ